MSQSAKIMEMKALGFSCEHIAIHLSLPEEQVAEVIRQNTPPEVARKKNPASVPGMRKKTIDRPAARHEAIPSPMVSIQKTRPPLLEVKPGVYILTAEDLLAFATSLQQEQEASPDPYLDYVPREVFQQQYGVSNTTILRYQKNGLLKIYRLGNKQFVRKSQVVKALEKGIL